MNTNTAANTTWFTLPAGYSVAKSGRRWLAQLNGETVATTPRRSDAYRAAQAHAAGNR